VKNAPDTIAIQTKRISVRVLFKNRGFIAFEISNR
jgi:hypothetical protein